MTREDMTRTILKSTIQKYISDISSDPDRSTRKLIDLGMNFSTGRFQKKFFNMAQIMLENEKSGYYSLVKNIIAHIDEETIKTFGINVGFNSCTHGAKIIREMEAASGFNIPWTVIFTVPPSGTECQSYLSKTGEYISQGRDAGIYTYILFAERNAADCIPLAEIYHDCAFLVFTSPEAVDENLLGMLKTHHNIFTGISTASNEFLSAAEQMKRKKILYGAYLQYTESQTDKIISGEWIDSFSKTECPFIILIADENVSDTSREKVARYVKEIRTGHNTPFVMVDMNPDLLAIDTIVSDDSCSVRFDANGYGHTLEKKLSCNMYNESLIDILRDNMPRKK